MRKYSEFFDSLDTIPIEKLPDLELYMDQVTKFLDDKLLAYKQEKSDRAITKTMVNNYTKAKMLPVSNKKKYSKEHLLFLILIFHLKSILSIDDISKIIGLLPDSISDFYGSFLKIQEEQISKLKEENEKSNINDKMELIFSLAFEIELKKMMIEYILNQDSEIIN